MGMNSQIKEGSGASGSRELASRPVLECAMVTSYRVSAAKRQKWCRPIGRVIRRRSFLPRIRNTCGRGGLGSEIWTAELHPDLRKSILDAAKSEGRARAERSTYWKVFLNTAGRPLKQHVVCAVELHSVILGTGW